MNIEKKFSKPVQKIEKLDNNLDFWLEKKNLESLEKIPENDRAKVIGRSVEYFLTFPNDSDLQLSELNYQDNKEKVKFYIDKTAQTLNFDNWEDEKSQEKILEFLFNKFEKEGNFYHAFNGCFLDKIQQDGLSSKERIWQPEKIKEIHSIFKKAGYSMVFGWFNLNSVNRLSVSDYADNIYKYAIASPEWFAQFVGEGYHIPDKEPYDPKAYYQGDYQAAKRNVKMFLDRLMSRSEEKIKKGLAYPNISKKEREQILDFFEEYWFKFKNQSKPQVAIIKKSVIDKNVENINIKDYFEDDDLSWQEKIEILLTPDYIDKQIEQAIKTEDFDIMELPDYNKVYKN